MLSCSSPKRRLSWDFSPHRRMEKKHLLPSKCMTFLVPLGGKDRKGSSSPPLACEESTDYWCDGQEAVSGQTLFSAGTCTPAIPCPRPVCWDALACPYQALPLFCSSRLCHFLSLERQRWGSRLPAVPEEQRVSIGGISL